MSGQNRVAGFGLILVAACMVCAVMWTQQDSDVVRENWTQQLQKEAEDSHAALPETEFVESDSSTEPAQLIQTEEATAVGSAAAAMPIHPADLDLDVWTGYTKLRDDASKVLSETDAHAVSVSCAKIRREGAEQCGAVYCAAQSECGQPCPEAYAQPQEQVIPLQPGGPRFHRIAEVDGKEARNKELHKKETDAKEKAIKEHAEKAKEKAQKEAGYKAKVHKEKQSKEVAMKEMEAAEHGSKGELQVEISTKEGEVKQHIAELKQKTISTCTKASEDGYTKCEEEAAEREQKEVQQKEVAEKAAAAAHNEEMEKAYAKEMAEGSAAAGLHAARAYASGDMGDYPGAFGSGEFGEEDRYESAGPTPDLIPEAHAGGSAGDHAGPEVMGMSDGECAGLDAGTCITTLGCNLDADTNECHMGLPPGMDEEVAGAPTLCVPQTTTSTQWLGYYVQNGHHDMDFDLNFEPNGSITGEGSDGIGAFTWSGTYTGDHVDATKQYTGKHSVDYQGLLTRTGTVINFDGTWTIAGCCSDSFHMEEQTHTITLGCQSDGHTAAADADVHPFSEADTCVDDDHWVDSDGHGCDSLAIDADYCSAHGTEVHPGMGCNLDGSDCKTADQACCMCKIVTNPATMSCTDSDTWQNSGGNSCAAVDQDFCTEFGGDIFPGQGCSEDAHDCLSANEACCTCKTGGDLQATGSAGRRLLAAPKLAKNTGPVPTAMLSPGPQPVVATKHMDFMATGSGSGDGDAEAGFKCYEHGGNVLPYYTANACSAQGKDAQYAGANKDGTYGECLKVSGGSYSWDNRKICPPIDKDTGHVATPAPVPTEPAPAVTHVPATCCFLHGGNVMPFYTAESCATQKNGKWYVSPRSADEKAADLERDPDSVFGECLKTTGGSYTWDNKASCDGKDHAAPCYTKHDGAVPISDTNAAAAEVHATGSAAPFPAATGSAFEHDLDHLTPAPVPVTPEIPDPEAPVEPLDLPNGAPAVAEESDIDAGSPAPPGFRVVSGDLVPTEEHIERLIEAEQNRIAAAGSAKIAAEALAEAKLKIVTAAEEAAMHAAGSAAIIGFEQQRDVAAAQLVKDVFVRGIEGDLNATHELHHNATQFLEAYGEHEPDPPNPCSMQKGYYLQACAANKTAELGEVLAKLMAEAEAEHKKLADSAADEAAEWGRALKVANETAAKLEAIEKEAADDLEAHIQAQPQVRAESFLQDADSCELAKETAYSECRTTQNAAYDKCRALWHGAAPMVDMPTGSGAKKASARHAWVASGSAMASISLLEGAVYTSKKNDKKKVHPKKAPKKEAKKEVQGKGKQQKAKNTKKISPKDFMSGFMGAANEIVHNDAVKDVAEVADQDDADNQELWQEADTALKALGFPTMAEGGL